MRARGWVVRELAEFFPDQPNLLGLNVNKGQKILLRLRYPGDRNQFLPVEQVTDTMLHELSHIVHGPHDQKFHALWNQLREEHEALVRKGYTGEGFLSEGHRLGGRQIPMHEARRLARAAAERRRVLSAGSGQRLGGRPPPPGQDIRSVITSAIERRNKTLQGCGNTNHTESEIREISDRASRNGFRTQAEEDAANEAAIAQALWELVQEEEQQKYGDSYIPATAENPTGNGGGTVVPRNQRESAANRTQREAQPQTNVTAPESELQSASPPSASPLPNPVDSPGGWTCRVCTLRNPPQFLCCDACLTERSAEDTKRLVDNSSKWPRAAVVDLTSSPTGASRSRTRVSENTASKPPPATWTCSFCGTVMERKWWTCSACYKMKDNSR
ncbi:hypothetical protein VTK73DRAFT_7704 [Phialemonium thermophilum]|uniref:Uncharacterized protein n=1 Tax=Phialemonium thermophilum TaxID=223376 RepID=A0ABR3XSP9_9PEZI